MPQAFKMLTDSAIEPEAKAGTTVYSCSKHDFGCASDDTRITGVQHKSFTLREDGGYPFFTHPFNKVEQL